MSALGDVQLHIDHSRSIEGELLLLDPVQQVGDNYVFTLVKREQHGSVTSVGYFQLSKNDYADLLTQFPSIQQPPINIPEGYEGPGVEQESAARIPDEQLPEDSEGKEEV